MTAFLLGKDQRRGPQPQGESETTAPPRESAPSNKSREEAGVDHVRAAPGDDDGRAAGPERGHAGRVVAAERPARDNRDAALGGHASRHLGDGEAVGRGPFSRR